MSNESNPAYRADIDGLRAIAVLSVVFFHAFPTLLTGGFVGVDVFFVISGFLITGILYRESAFGKVSFSRFYSKRVRRIFPALLMVLVFSLTLGWVALTADEYTQLTRHAAAGAAFLSNVVFWRESGYFDNPAETKPLLHLWSLAIEEQFYLFWPLLFVFLVRAIKGIRVAIGGLILASITYSVYKVGVDPVGDFYSLLTRFWELMVGGLLACVVSKNQDFGSQFKNFIAFVGLALLAVANVLIDKTSAFPGLWALLPVLGAAALILSRGSIINQKVLAHPLLVGVGLISYPLYLWHWPLLSFARIFEGQIPTVPVRLGLVIASFMLAWVTYRFAEKPIRHGGHARVKVVVLSFCMFITFCVAFYIKSNHGFGYRQYEKLNGDASTMVIGADRATHKHECGLQVDKMQGVEWCIHDNKLASPNYAVLGDSKGEALYYGLSRESRPSQSWLMIGPVNFLSGYTSGLAKVAMDRVTLDPKINLVVLGNALRGITKLNPSTGFIDYEVGADKVETWVSAYTSAIEHLQVAGKQVIFVMDNPTFPDPGSCISGEMTGSALLNHFIYRNSNTYCQIAYSDHLKGTAPYREFVRQLAQRNPKLLVIDSAPELCDAEKGVCSILEGRRFLYSYGDHISDYASSKIAKKILLAIPANINQ